MQHVGLKIVWILLLKTHEFLLATSHQKEIDKIKANFWHLMVVYIKDVA